MTKIAAITALIIAFCLGVVATEVPSTTEIDLDEGWQFRQLGTDRWYGAKVPGSVHLDLMDNRLIPDPFYRDNEKDLQWIGKTDWEYRTSLEITADAFRREKVELVFEGLDTYADVFLNGQEILRADNMFRTWVVNVKKHVKQGSNELKIRFRSPINEILPRMSKLSYQLPASNDQGEKTSPYTRKAPYQFGWDWGPRLVGAGVWRSVRLRAWDSLRIESLDVRQVEVTSEKARLAVAAEIVASAESSTKLILRDRSKQRVLVTKDVRLNVGVNEVLLGFEIENPELWYPVGLGKQHLYEFELNASSKDGVTDSRSEKTGVRTVELRQKPDKWGISFEFVINGIPVFAKGGNWIPADSFPSRVTREKYRHLMESFRDANMNMVRVWGGGIYEDDYFYELADELGLLVWQDFMFACSMYPADKPFLETVRQEAIDNIKRLRNHPSIVLWCGNNEVETAWNHWGWKQRLPSHIWDDYLKIFARLLPEVVEEHDPETPYWSSSPSSNFQDDSDSQKVGDVHYWGVWHASLPFEEYQKQFPRFMSEYGFQSFPDLETVKAYTKAEDRTGIETPVMLAHQRHPRGNQLIREYMLREFEEPKDFESFLYVSQVLQAEGMRIGTEHLRRIMPRNMGALYWQLNDCWPVASWSGTDYFGRWKALHYYARRFFEPLMVSPVQEGKDLSFYVVSDLPETTKADIVVKSLRMDGTELYSEKIRADIRPIAGASYLKIPVEKLLKGNQQNDVVVSVQLKKDGEVVSSNEFFFKAYKEMSFEDPDISVGIDMSGRTARLVLSSQNVAKAVRLSWPDMKGRFSDNYFNLIPGVEKVVTLETKNRVSEQDLRKRLKVTSLFDAFD